jgi:hypothetical protein
MPKMRSAFGVWRLAFGVWRLAFGARRSALWRCRRSRRSPRGGGKKFRTTLLVRRMRSVRIWAGMDFDLGGTNLWILAVLISGRSIAFRRKNEWLKQLRADARLFSVGAPAV